MVGAWGKWPQLRDTGVGGQPCGSAAVGLVLGLVGARVSCAGARVSWAGVGWAGAGVGWAGVSWGSCQLCWCQGQLGWRRLGGCWCRLGLVSAGAGAGAGWVTAGGWRLRAAEPGASTMAVAPDERHGLLESFATLVLRLRPDKWNKFMDSSEAAAELDEFFKQQDVRELVLGLNPAGHLQATAAFPPAIKGKGIYFVKKKEESITRENCRSALLVGDVGASPVEQLITVMDEVVYPLLLSERSLARWPRVVAEEVMHQAHHLRSELLVMGGKIQGKPLLPLPENLDGPDNSSAILDRWVLVALVVPAEPGWGPGQHVPWGEVGARTPARSLGVPGRSSRAAEHPGAARAGLGRRLRAGAQAPPGQCWNVTGLPSSLAGPVDVSVLHAIETTVIEWSHQIRDVLSKSSAQPLLEGLHPLPRTEFEFWSTRTVHLQCINDQLLSPRVTALAEILEKADSCYWRVLQSMFRDVRAGLEEAKDIDLYLQPLRILLEEMEQADYSELQPYLDRVMCTLCLVRVHCQHYSAPARLVVILREICNLLIEMTRSVLTPEDVLKGLQGEMDEVLGGIRLSIATIEQLFQSYRTYCCDLAPTLCPEEPQLWDFLPSLIFGRIEAFLHRLRTIEELYETAIEFLKLEKTEMGGVRGNILGSQVFQIYEEVSELIKTFSECSYDALDPAEEQLNKDFAEFQKKIEDMDRRLAALLCQGFDDCNSMASAMKLVHMFAFLLERPLIKAEVSPYYSVLLGLFKAELENVKVLFDTQTASSGGGPALHSNMPPVAGRLKWAKELQQRLEETHGDLFAIDHPVMTSTEAQLVSRKYEEMMGLLQGYCEKVYEEWASGAGRDCRFTLEQPLICRDPESSLLSVNFSRELVAVLREVKYLNFQQQKDIPDSAENLFAQHDTFQKFVDSLDLIVGWYNEVRQRLLPVEFPLLGEELAAVDDRLASAEQTLFWHHEGVMEYIQETRGVLDDLQTRVQKAKLNVERITQLMEECSDDPLFERKDKKDTALLDLDGKANTLAKRYAAITDAGVKIQGMVEENAELFKADKSSQIWLDYMEYLDGIVLDGFFRLVHRTLQFLLTNMVPDEEVAPLFEVHLELSNNTVQYRPSLDTADDNSFLKLMESLLRDTYSSAARVPRLLEGQLNYETMLEEHAELSQMQEQVLSLAVSAMREGIEYSTSFEEQNYLWREDPAEFLQRFLALGSGPGPEEPQLEEPPAGGTPTLQMFQQEIDAYEELCQEVSEFSNTELFRGWLRCNCRPFKQALLTAIRRRGQVLRQHLSNHVTTSLQELEDFIREANVGLSKPLQEGDYDGLVEVMGHLMRVKDRQVVTDDMFGPLKETIALLSTYGDEMPEEVHLQLQELPERWDGTKKLALRAKQNAAPLQASEVNVIHKKCQQFEVRQLAFREVFQENAPFLYAAPEPYRSLKRQQKNIAAMESDLAALCQSAKLFEVLVPKYKQLKVCRRELCLLKQLWDMIVLVNTSIDDWKTTRWKEINVEQMDIDCKKFAKDIRSLDKEMRSWDAYTGLDNSVKNMITSLRAVNELQNPAIRDRHWQELMKATKVNFTMSEDTTLAELLQLNLHKFEDEVSGIVDKAIKESGMEKVLNSLDTTWAAMEFEHETHARTGIVLLKSNEEMIETLEDHQTQLQNMMTSKYLAFFLQEVSSWQQKLSTTDSVINIWFELQRTWSHLESIFVGSEDIRSQLPEESKLFDTIDEEFKVIMADAVKTPKVIEATNKPGLYDKLEELQKRLAVCEKALAEYLETKRLAFPRFYFVSSADLLDILSNGTEPVEVSRHLSKLFDSLAKLKFKTGADKKPLKVALGMFSGDEEYVPFDADCDLSGQVEVWLNRVLGSMRATLRSLIPEALATYEEKAREQWVFDYPAQVALTCTQIWWTTEVGMAFSKLEEGYENAIKDYNKKQITQLNTLISLLIGNLSAGDRMKIMTICTIDVHARDVVAKMILTKVESAQAFTWQSQLRHRWDDGKKHCYANICDAQLQYSYEYLGNTPRLVITPLTDRCYITLTQSLHLYMGGAPAGPAGTGKTETTKDLGRAIGTMVYVFNCSEQMDYKSCGNIYKGLAQTGAWGCFDEFNRIAVEVLSVIAVQVKCIQDAIRAKKKTFDFLGEKITLVPSVGLFITMNPGYAGRTELPENLKALFRPCAMVVPDFELICEIMLVAEGFMDAKLLARKFITLYTLCKELLSKQDHYDWGLRAIKSVLVVAGSLKRGDPGRAEDQVLMRALRDFNIPKIVTDDLPVFMGLIGDLFPALDVPRKRDLNFEKIIKQAVVELKLQAEESFVLKVVQLEELLQVRHSVFVIGNTGCGKSQVLKSLNRTYQMMKRRPVTVDLDPKAVTCDELFGVIHPATREWKDGLFSTAMRDLANITHKGPKWIILDGDIDPMWIESLNTVMDDNKILTLASNERIPLNPTMRLLFEISHLRTATPATVSRAGILYINPADLGWNPIVTSWVDTRAAQSERASLTLLFDKYLPVCLEKVKKGFKTITPVPEVTVIHTVLHLLECLLTPQTVPPDSPRDLYELYFVFACTWAFGGAMFQDQLTDYRLEFSKWWVSEFKTVKYPAQGTIFDYYIDPKTRKFMPWTEKVPKFELDPEVPLQASMVHTAETTRVRYFMDLLMEQRRPVMLVGNAGTGKSVMMRDKLAALSTDEYFVQFVPFNFYTTSAMLQAVLEKPLEKKSGRNYGPPGARRLIYFVDDMNMPEVDKYGTVAPHTLIRQHMDHGHWYDRTKLTLKDIHNCQYVACMNPTAGSFTIDPRLQRHFCVFAVSFPGQEALLTVYSTILAQHLQLQKMPPAVQKLQPQLVAAALALHQKVASIFLPTAIKFHYIFNLRDLSNIFQGLLFSTPECLKAPVDLVRLWLHEAERVYGDKLVDEKDQTIFGRTLVDTCQKFFGELGEELVFAKPNIYFHFAQGLGDPKYLPVPSWPALNKLLGEALDGYNEVNAAMSLVLFEDAVSHICRISRILESPQGNALLVGVGGSGKQSLARLAAFISNLNVFQITLRKGYSIPDLKLDLAAQYVKAAVKNLPTVFLMTDSQVAEESFLVLINDFLASGEVPGLFQDDEVEEIISAMRTTVKLLGLPDTRENCWKLFIDKVRRQLKVILCFSPVGSTLRVRARRFPAVVNCTAIDWFHEWPEDALVSVSSRFLEETGDIEPEVKVSISRFMAHVHTSVKEMSKRYLSTERRYNYTTPKTFLEQIKLYQNLLSKKRSELTAKIERLEKGLMKLQSTTSQVDDLKAKLAIQEIELKQKNEDADKLIHVVGVETQKVSKEKAIADEEELKVQAINTVVTEKQRACETDLAKAEPALVAAQEALDTLNKNNLTELKSFGSPPQAVVNVTAAVMVLTAPNGKIPKDKSWKAAKVMMGKVDAFLDALKKFDKEHIPEPCLKAFQPYQADPSFDPEFIMSKSTAAAGLCSWCLNIVRFYEVYCEVEPKRLALAEANAELAEAQEKLARIKKKIADLNANLAALTADFQKATAEKLKCQQEADATNRVITLANRLIGGLASENVRWAESVEMLRQQENTVCGDVLLVSAFVSYVGYFTKKYRTELLEKDWVPFLGELAVPIPTTPELDPLTLLTDAADVATWSNQGLPSDRTSIENATILCNTERWPLVVDAQLQGIKWIKNKYGEDLRAIRLGQRSYLDAIERAVAEGQTLLIEDVGETMEPVLDHLLGRNTIKKGRYIKIGDKEVEYHPRFRLILHTKYFNPHYKPEVQAQCTLINFLVTREGLEDQLLAAVVAKERPDLETLKANLTKSQNEFKIKLKELEDSLLARLSAAGGEFLEDTALVENLETTKRTAIEIEEKVKEAKVTEVQINVARENYRPAAERASLLYFILSDLNKINPIYQFSLKAFSAVFEKAIQHSAPSDDIQQRVINLTDEITYSVYTYTARGLFEADKLIFLAQVTFQVLTLKKEVNPVELDFLLRFPCKAGVTSPVDFLQHQGWGGIKVLSEMEEFRNLDNDIEGSAKRWKKFVESEVPEKEVFPKEWKSKTALQKLCMLRCMRPDRMTYAIRDFVEEKMGSKYVEGRSVELFKAYKESSPSTPLFFILSPGVDPLKDLEVLGKKLNFTIENGKIHNVSLGQGQEVVAERALETAALQGHWVILQNIHLVARWLGRLEKLVEQYSEGSHADYRVFMSAEPAPTPEAHIIPQGLLEDAIKITNEPPTGMFANLHKALDLFTQDTLEMSTKEMEFKCILFALCYFHAVVAERRKFGTQGWNRPYPFNNGDLTISINVLYNYLEANPTVPWDDLRYLFGEIMYGGHITDDWDRRLCRTYLSEYVQPEMLDGEVHLAPGFLIPPSLDYKVRKINCNLAWETTALGKCALARAPSLTEGECREKSFNLMQTHRIAAKIIPVAGAVREKLRQDVSQNRVGCARAAGGEAAPPRAPTFTCLCAHLLPPPQGYHQYIDENLPPESPYLYGLHPNAEIGFLTLTSEQLFRTVLEMQPKESDAAGGSGVSREEKVQAVLEEILEKLPEPFNMMEIMAKAEEKTPFVVVAFQECERMNILTQEIRRSLKELNLGLKGELTITADMEELATALFYDSIPESWTRYAYPSLLSLGAWYADLLLRIRELDVWTTDFVLPATVWLAGFFNPQSFLTAIMQSMARKNEWPLDKMCLTVDVTKKYREEITAPPREGSFVHGLFMEGARWDVPSGAIADARLKELTPVMPVIFIRAIPVDRLDTKNTYECPVYKTRMRGPTYVWTFNLKTKEKAAKWILAGVALLLQS
ncbi:dynein axonemal heavy chain 17 isoform X3 [Columba livia]|uniref:dynein axonemal heavy chain 17 isoform X3 n=1 Tax=Columba livia TaxID=8932 RepID=UPI0031BA68CC